MKTEAMNKRTAAPPLIAVVRSKAVVRSRLWVLPPARATRGTLSRESSHFPNFFRNRES